MKFDNYQYHRPDLETLSSSFDQLLSDLEKAENPTAAVGFVRELDRHRRDFDTMYNLCYIRHSIDTTDNFYETENNWFDAHLPDFQQLNNRFYRSLLESKFQKEMEEIFGEQLFNIARMKLEVFSPEIMDDLREENRLATEYMKIKATAEFDLDGTSYNLSTIRAPMVDRDRHRREQAHRAQWAFYAEHRDRIESIFDQLVKVRHRIARTLGFKNFIELGYKRMLRSDYDANRVADFRQQVREQLVPLCTELYERQQQRLGLDRLTIWDEDFRFRTGNAAPQGDPAWIVARAERMYRELSDETHEFFQFMQERGLMNLVSQMGKATGGYCTLIDNYESPFIFSNFNGTSDDIDVLTHEAGHAFQVYESRALGVSDYAWPTYEACEIHSMSMEFFTWPWMELFFEGETEKYKFAHLAGALRFIPYGVAVDAFQHYVYEHPEATPAERNAAWRDLERQYLPQRDYDDIAVLNEGIFWQRQNHIFASPFYYIDYCLAEVCALQFWHRANEDRSSAWRNYLRLCRAGGSRSFLKLVELAGLRSPFERGTMAETLEPVRAYLMGVEDGEW